MTNPYAGSDLEQVWSSGYEQGHNVPSDLSPPFPASLADHDYSDPNAPLQSVWLEGVHAGVLAAEDEEKARQGESVDVDPAVRPPEASHEDPDKETKVFGVHMGVHAVTTAGEILETGVVAGSLTSFFIGGFLALAFATSETPEGERPTDESALQRWFAEKCTAAGATDLFLAYCKGCAAPGHGSGSDALAQAGWWHGQLYKGDHSGALQEAKEHLQSDPDYQAIYKQDAQEVDRVRRGEMTGHKGRLGQQTGLLHYKASNPEMLETTTLTPPELSAGSGY